MIKAVTFDLWNTVIEGSSMDYTRQRVNYLVDVLKSQSYSVDFDAVIDAYASAEAAFRWAREREFRFVSVRDRVDLILERLRIRLTEKWKAKITKEFEEAALKNPPPLVNGAKFVLESLYGKYLIGLICDSGVTPGRMLRKVLAANGVLKYFNCTVFSDEVGYNKPHSLMFSEALEKLRIKAEEAVHVGDLLSTDVAGAKAAGMKAVWVNRNKEAIQNTSYKPDYEISSLPKLIDLLENVLL